MVLKTTTCRFSGLRIYPGRGILFVRTDGQQYLFINRKTKSLFGQRKRPAKIAWTTTYRKQHKKDQEAQIARKKRRATTRTQARSIAGTSLEVINKRRAEKPEVRKASREAALREVKDRLKKAKQEKAAPKLAEAKCGSGKVKERLKNSKQEKAALKSAEAKRGGGKAAKNVPGARAPGAKSGTRR